MWKFSVLLLLVFLSSCWSDRRLEAALEFAGDNRGDLEKVLVHYRDSGQKYDAARFLIESMPAYYSYKGAALDSAKTALNTAGVPDGYLWDARPLRNRSWSMTICLVAHCSTCAA